MKQSYLAICAVLIIELTAGWALSEEPKISPDQQTQMNALVAKRNAAQKEAAAAQAEIDALKTKIGMPAKPGVVDPDDEDVMQIIPEARKWGIQLRRSATSEKQFALPAMFQYTRPSPGEDSYSIDAGLLIAPPQLEFDLFGAPAGWRALVEYHYNSATGSLKDTLLTGGGIEWVSGDGDAGFWGVIDGLYKKDNLIAGEAGVVSLLLYPRLAKANIGSVFFENRLMNGRFQPYIGTEFESGNGASKAFPEGNRISLRAGLSLTTGLLPKALGNRLDWTNTLGYWGNVDTSGFYNSYDDSQLYFISSANYWLNTDIDHNGKLSDDEKIFGFTLSYENGDNPLEGSFEKDVWTLGLSVKF